MERLVQTMRILFITALLLASLSSWSSPASASLRLVFGVYPSERPSKMVRAFRPVLDAIEKSMSVSLGEEVEIKTQVLPDYRTGLNSLLSGAVDFARLGPASYVLGKREDPRVAILAMENEKGTVEFDGVIVVREGNEVTDVSDLKGRTFAFGAERSTLGRYFAQAYLAGVGILAEDLGAYDYLRHHEAVGLAVGAGRYDAGALNRRMFEKLKSRGVRLREIASYQNVTRPWVARSGLERRVRESLLQALLDLDDPQVLLALGFDGFLPGDDAYYDKTRRALIEYVQFDRKSTSAPANP